MIKYELWIPYIAYIYITLTPNAALVVVQEKNIFRTYITKSFDILNTFTNFESSIISIDEINYPFSVFLMSEIINTFTVAM